MERSFSDSSLGLVAELVRWHLPARSLVRFKLVSKEWNTWCSDNLSELAKVRRRTTVKRDFYFPIAFAADGLAMARTWSAIHHASEEEHAEEHKLPDLDFLPNWSIGRANHYIIAAASGGLFLFKYKFTFGGVLHWYVVNPLTRNWRRLSCGNCVCEEFGPNLSDSLLHAHIMVDEELRQYKVVVLTKSCVNVYSSHNEQWVCNPIRLSTGLNGGGRAVDRLAFPGSAYANGDVFMCSRFSTVVVPGEASDGTPKHRTMIEIQMCPVEPGEGQRRLAVTAVAVDNFRARLDCYLGFGDFPAKPKLVECMGNLYVVASQSDAYHTSHEDIAPAPEVFTMRRTFHIFKVLVGNSVCLLHVRHVSERALIERPLLSRLWVRRGHFSCTARSSVIWLAWEDRMLQYDVVSNVWKSDCHSSALLKDEDNAPSDMTLDAVMASALDRNNLERRD